MRTLMGDLLNAQYPVIDMCGILTVLQRAAATITMVAVFSIARCWRDAGNSRSARSSVSSDLPV